MKVRWRSRLHSDCQFAHSQLATLGTVHDAEATRRSALERPSWARTCVAGWQGLRGLGGHWGCDEMECGGAIPLLLLLHPEGPRRCKWPLCLCSCSWLPRRAQGCGAGAWHPMSGGVLGRRERRGPTQTLLTVLRPPAPKNIAFNLQGVKGFTGPWWTRISEDQFSYSSSLNIFTLRKKKGINNHSNKSVSHNWHKKIQNQNFLTNKNWALKPEKSDSVNSTVNQGEADKPEREKEREKMRWRMWRRISPIEANLQEADKGHYYHTHTHTHCALKRMCVPTNHPYTHRTWRLRWRCSVARDWFCHHADTDLHVAEMVSLHL